MPDALAAYLLFSAAKEEVVSGTANAARRSPDVMPTAASSKK
jgi:hypothetical protein